MRQAMLPTTRGMTVAAVSAVALCWLAPPAHAQELRIATMTPAGSPWNTTLERGAKKLAELTEGRVQKKYYAGGIMGSEADVVRKMKLKKLDGAVLTMAGLSEIYPGIRVLELPMMFRSEEEVTYVRAKMWPHFRKQFQAQGFVITGPGGAGWSYVYTGSKVQSVDDLKKTTMWVWSGDQVMRAMFEKLGVSTVPMSLGELAGALKTGRVDACYGPPMGAVAFQWFNNYKYATSTAVSYALGTTILRKDVWEQMSDKDRKATTKVDRFMEHKFNRRVAADNNRSMRAMKRGGIAVVPTPSLMQNDMEKAAEAAWTEFADKTYTQEELDLVLKYRAEFRASQAAPAAQAAPTE